jgi:hypothetical protein
VITKQFEISDIRKYRLFYVLKKFFSGDSVEVYHRSVGGLDEFNDGAILDTNGLLIVALPNQFIHTGKYNLVATDGVTSEIVNLHHFERIWKYYKLGHSNDNPGAFTFLNSMPAYDETRSWRCDYGLYGPEIFEDPSGQAIIEVPQELSGLLVYEPLLSVNGVGHLTYAVRENKSNRLQMLNDSYTPFASQTFGGAIKLITEWASMVGPPFGNEEPIAIKAKEFCDSLDITNDLVANQPDMQIFNYLNGEDSARVAPTPVMFSESLDLFLKNNMAHSTFSSVLCLHPEIEVSLPDAIAIEKELITVDKTVHFDRLVYDNAIDLNDDAQVISYLDETHKHAGISAFMRLFLEFSNTKKQLIEYIEENGNLP